MSWFGYGLYDGDGTQTCHINFIKTALPQVSEEEIFSWLGRRKTLIPKSYIIEFRKGSKKILAKIKKPKNIFKWDEDDAIEWQMLLALFLDNNLMVPHDVSVYGTLACHYLLGEHTAGFDKPATRRAAIKRFMKKADESAGVKARQEIAKRLT